MIIELEKKLKLTTKERQILKDCEFLLIEIAKVSDELSGEFIDIDDSDIDNAIDSLSIIYDMSEEYFGV
jgi:hypothetical protein